jgi:hypothetical protein
MSTIVNGRKVIPREKESFFIDNIQQYRGVFRRVEDYCPRRPRIERVETKWQRIRWRAFIGLCLVALIVVFVIPLLLGH